MKLTTPTTTPAPAASTTPLSKNAAAPPPFRYQKKISGPLITHIDIHVEVPPVDYENLADKHNVEDSKTIRAYHRVLKLTRTTADLAGSEMIMANHVAEAVQY